MKGSSTLKELREHKGLTLQQVVDHLNSRLEKVSYCGRAVVAKWEKGSVPPYEVVEELAALYEQPGVKQIYEAIKLGAAS